MEAYGGKSATKLYHLRPKQKPADQPTHHCYNALFVHHRRYPSRFYLIQRISIIAGCVRNKISGTTADIRAESAERENTKRKYILAQFARLVITGKRRKFDIVHIGDL